MGSNQFQKEYIEYLEKKNEELLTQLTLLRENYDNKIFSKDISKHYLVNTLEELMNVCIVLPQEIDLFFDKITSAMQGLKNVLMKKSELVQTVNKISKIISSVKSNTDFPINQESNLVNGPKFELNNGNIGKVLPMIDGHIISTGPRLYLSRITENLTPGKRENPIELSPIVEVSPEANLENSDIERLCLKEIKISLERINTNNLSCPFPNRESTPSRLTRSRLTKENEQVVKEVAVGTSNDDPLEGTSSMYCDGNQSQVSSSDKFNCFVDFKRRKHRFATMFNNNDRSSGMDLLSEENKTQSQEKSLLQNKSSCLRANTNSSTSSAKYNRATNNSSQDFIDESVNGNKQELSGKSSRINTSKEENNFENFKKDIKKTTSTPSGVKTNIFPKNLYKTDASHQDSVEENPSTDKLDRNSSSKLNSRVSFEGSTKTNDNSKTLTPRDIVIESRLSGSKKNKKNIALKLKKQRSKSKKKLSSSTNFKKAESTLSSKNFIEVSQRDSISVESGSFENTSENGSRRAKRKAAPTNLKEPLLSTKLRRD